MRYFILFWLLPVGFLVTWLQLSANDMSFGMMFFSREMYDLVFGIYGDILGIDPAILPPMIYKALALDTVLIGAIVAFRRRKAIIEWFKQRANARVLEARVSAMHAGDQVRPAE
jgi:hypothetical protein